MPLCNRHTLRSPTREVAAGDLTRPRPHQLEDLPACRPHRPTTTGAQSTSTSSATEPADYLASERDRMGKSSHRGAAMKSTFSVGIRQDAAVSHDWVRMEGSTLRILTSVSQAPRTTGRDTVLKTLGTYAALAGGIAAVIGVVFGLRQLALQAQAAKLSVLVVINEGWKKRKNIALDRTDRDRWTSEAPLSPETTAVVRQALGVSGAAPVAVTSTPLLDPVPFALLLLAPQWSGAANPVIARNEESYTAQLKRRCEASFVAFEALSNDDAAEEPREAFARLSLMTERFVSEMNDIAELVESRIMNPVDFLRKRHFSVMREVYVVEPLILWRSCQPGVGRWGMRVLALGAAARAFHWTDELHCFKDVETLSPRERAAFGEGSDTLAIPDLLIGGVAKPRAAIRRLTQTGVVLHYFSQGYRAQQNDLLAEMGGMLRKSHRIAASIRQGA